MKQRKATTFTLLEDLDLARLAPAELVAEMQRIIRDTLPAAHFGHYVKRMEALGRLADELAKRIKAG